MSESKGIIEIPKSPHLKDWGFGDNPYMKDGPVSEEELDSVMLKLGCVKKTKSTYLEMLSSYTSMRIQQSKEGTTVLLCFTISSRNHAIMVTLPDDLPRIDEGYAERIVDYLTTPKTCPNIRYESKA